MAKDEGKEEDGEDGEDGSEGDGEKKSPNIKKLILFIAVPIVVLLIGGGAALYFTGVFSPKDESTIEDNEHAGDEDGGKDDHGKNKEKDSHAKKKGGHGGGGEEDSSAFLVMPPINVNLQSEGGQARFLRLSVALELEDPDDKEAIAAVLPRVVDAFQTYLRELRVEDLRGSAGLYRLQIELLWRVNQAADPVKVKDVLFQEILVN